MSDMAWIPTGERHGLLTRIAMERSTIAWTLNRCSPRSNAKRTNRRFAAAAARSALLVGGHCQRGRVSPAAQRFGAYGTSTAGSRAPVCLRNGKAAREFTVSHEQTETNPAQPRERLENAGERHLCRPTDCLGKPVRGGLAADERRNAHGRKSRRVIRAAPR